MIQTAERISHVDMSDNVIFQRSLFAYLEAAKLAGKTILEIGSGMGYGINYLQPVAEKYIALDKYRSEAVSKALHEGKINFLQMKVPMLTGIEDNSIDCVVSFQVIEHIRNDKLFLKEVHRVLAPCGKLIVTTPNIKMSLTRNPWHIREYTKDEIENLFSLYFKSIKLLGVFGNDKVMLYYENNKEAVKKFTRFDIFNFQYWIPRFILKIPYNILNRINRKKLLGKNKDKTLEITTSDYILKEADDLCFDFFVVANK